jgi:hypothetical protein
MSYLVLLSISVSILFHLTNVFVVCRVSVSCVCHIGSKLYSQPDGQSQIAGSGAFWAIQPEMANNE